MSDSTPSQEPETADADSTSGANPKTVAEAPVMALSGLYQSSTHAAGLAQQNLVTAQQQMAVLAQAALTQAVDSLLAPQGEQ